MPDDLAIIALLIEERPLCLDCIAIRARVPGPTAREQLSALRVRQRGLHEDDDRCRACGNVDTVYWVARVPALRSHDDDIAATIRANPVCVPCLAQTTGLNTVGVDSALYRLNISNKVTCTPGRCASCQRYTVVHRIQ